MKKGISLIVLVITIIVIIILAGAVILTLTNNNIMGTASQAVFKNDVQSIRAAITLKSTDRMVELYTKGSSTISLDWANAADMKTNVPGLNDQIAKLFVVEDGILKILTAEASTDQKAWATELGIESK